MIRLCMLFAALISSLAVPAQSNWVNKEVGNNISVKFPIKPEYKLADKSGIYSLKTDNNLLLAVVQYDVLPNYAEFVKLPQDQQAKLIDVFLDNTIRGVLTSSGNEGAAFTNIQIGKYKGRQTSYPAVNPATGESTMNYCKIIYAYNKVFTFQCRCRAVLQ